MDSIIYTLIYLLNLRIQYYNHFVNVFKARSSVLHNSNYK